jgi:hypothetical protein
MSFASWTAPQPPELEDVLCEPLLEAPLLCPPELAAPPEPADVALCVALPAAPPAPADVPLCVALPAPAK